MKIKEKDFVITLKTFYGFEEVLSDELKELNYNGIEILNRAVQIRGNWDDVYFLNLHIRCAISILVELSSFRINSERDLYNKAKKLNWDELFTYKRSIAVKGAVFSDIFKSTQYPMLLVKDAIVDVFRDKYGQRPDVSVSKPEILIDLYIRNNQVVLSLNTSGAPLFQRGYRTEAGLAPLNEVVAACLLRMSGWDRKTPFLDPFCGSGTLLVEAALLASGIPSNIERHYYAFKNLLNYDQDLWMSIYEKVNRNVSKLPCEIIGIDISDSMIIKTRRNLRTFPFARDVKTNINSFDSISNSETPYFVLTNPPYGERMGEEVEELYAEIGTWLKNKMTGTNFWMISSNMNALKCIALKHSKKVKVFNGNIECSFRQYEMYSGSKKK